MTDLPDADSFEATSDGFRNLREAYDKLKRENKEIAKARTEADQAVATLRKQLSDKSLGELTASLPANVKKFLTKDFERDGLEPTEQNVSAWLKENAADFGYDPNEKPEQEQLPQAPQGQEQQQLQGLSEEEIENQRQTQALYAGRTPGNLAATQVQSQLQDLDKRVGEMSTADLVEALKQMGAPVSGTRIVS